MRDEIKMDGYGMDITETLCLSSVLNKIEHGNIVVTWELSDGYETRLYINAWMGCHCTDIDRFKILTHLPFFLQII